MTVLFDLQEKLREMESGKLQENDLIHTYGRKPAEISIVEIMESKTVRVSGKSSDNPGFVLKTDTMPLAAGDRITVTGRIGSGAPKKGWGITIDRYNPGEEYLGLAQHVAPDHDELFSVTYLIHKDDLDTSLIIRSKQWENSTDIMDFCVDSILITRNSKGTGSVLDERKEIYSLADDKSFSILKPGDIFKYLQSSGTPKYEVFTKDGKKGILVHHRHNNWDGIDIRLAHMDIKPGNSYTISASGRTEGEVLHEARIMFQVIPGYIWRSETILGTEKEFVLNHTFSASELQNAQTVRIATDDRGANISFYIFDINITVN